jgi:glycosyltransferase involved in cell wall biosynthesis
VILQIQDLGATPQPYFMLQDLSYNLVLQHHGVNGTPHFRTLGTRRTFELRDRQVILHQGAAGLFPMSNWLAKDIIAAGVPPDRVHVVNPGTNIQTDLNAAIRPRRRGATSRLLMVGRDFDTKGGAQLLAAHRIVRSELGPGLRLTIIGPPRWPVPGHVPDGVDFLGPMPREDVSKAMDSHDLFVMPSLFEGFGIAFVEALVRGLPCIGRDVCAMPEIIDPYDGGRLVRSESPEELARLIVETLADDALYEACAAAAPKRRAHYTWRRAARSIAEVMSGVGG